MNTAKIYYDSDGNECTIHQMVKREPVWAAVRIQEGEKAIAKLEELESSRSPGCSKASAQQLADALDDIWLCANSGYLLEALKSKIALYVEGETSLTKGF